MTAEQISANIALCKRATPGAWFKHYGAAGGGIVRRWRDELGRRCTRFVAEVHLNTIGGEEQQSVDAAYIIASRDPISGWQACLEEIERLQTDEKRNIAIAKAELSHALGLAQAEIERRDKPVRVIHQDHREPPPYASEFVGQCFSCTGLVRQGSKFCPACGARLEWI